MIKNFTVCLPDKSKQTIDGDGFVIGEDKSLTVYDKLGKAVAYFPDSGWEYIGENQHSRITYIETIDAETGEPVRLALPNGGQDWTEKQVMNHLVWAYEGFLEIEGMPDSSRQEFFESINRCQSVLGQQVLSRLFPDYWNK